VRRSISTRLHFARSQKTVIFNLKLLARPTGHCLYRDVQDVWCQWSAVKLRRGEAWKDGRHRYDWPWRENKTLEVSSAKVVHGTLNCNKYNYYYTTNNQSNRYNGSEAACVGLNWCVALTHQLSSSAAWRSCDRHIWWFTSHPAREPSITHPQCVIQGVWNFFICFYNLFYDAVKSSDYETRNEQDNYWNKIGKRWNPYQNTHAFFAKSEIAMKDYVSYLA
jgi:hypothetical protein